MTRWAILTGEYPPQSGGVSDYTRLVAERLAAMGDEVAVYAPPQGLGPDSGPPGVRVRRLPDRFGLRGLRRLGRELARDRPDRILVQYVPHAFGLKAMNLPFAAWVAVRARRVAPVWVMFHEVAFPFVRQPLRHNLVAVVNRAMVWAVAGAADRVLVSIPSWGRLLSQVCPRARPAEWLPVPCSVATAADPGLVTTARFRHAPDPTAPLVGHFGTFGRLITDLLEPAIVGRMVKPARGSAKRARQPKYSRYSSAGVTGSWVRCVEIGQYCAPSSSRNTFSVTPRESSMLWACGGNCSSRMRNSKNDRSGRSLSGAT